MTFAVLCRRRPKTSREDQQRKKTRQSAADTPGRHPRARELFLQSDSDSDRTSTEDDDDELRLVDVVIEVEKSLRDEIFIDVYA
jgi:hypothetical protein